MYKKYKIINKKKYKIINLFNHLGGKMPDKYNEIVKELTEDIMEILLKIFKNDRLFNFIKENLLIYMPDYENNIFTDYLKKKLKFQNLKKQIEKKKDSKKSDSKKSDTSTHKIEKSQKQIKKEEKTKKIDEATQANIKKKEEWNTLSKEEKEQKKQKKKDKKKDSKTTQQTETPSSELQQESKSPEPITETPSPVQQESTSPEPITETPSPVQQESTSTEPITETPSPVQQESTSPEPTSDEPITEPTSPEPKSAEPTNPEPTNPEPTNPEPNSHVQQIESPSPKQQPDSEKSDTSKQKIEKSQKQKRKEVKDKKKASKTTQQTETPSPVQTETPSPVQTETPSTEQQSDTNTTNAIDETTYTEFLDTKREEFKLEDKISKFLTILINIYYVYTIKKKIYFKSVENCLKALASLIIYFFNLGLLFKTAKSLAGFGAFFVSSNLKQTEIDKIVDYNKHYLDSFDLINTYKNIYKGSLKGILFDFFNLIINDPKFISLYKESDGDDSYVQKFFLLLYRDAKSKNIPFVDEIYLLLPSYWIPLNANIIFPEFKEEIKELLRKKLLALLHRDSMLHGFQGSMAIKIKKIKEIKDNKIIEEKKIEIERKKTKENNLCIKGKYVYEKKDTSGNLIQIKYDEKNNNYHYGIDYSKNQCKDLLIKIRQEIADKELKQKSEEESNLGTKSNLVKNFKMGKKEKKEKEKVSVNEEFIEYVWYKSIVDEFDKTAKVPHFL